MKKYFNLKSISAVFISALILSVSFIFAFGDAYEPPDSFSNIELGVGRNEDINKVVSKFISNFSEAGFTDYDSSSGKTLINKFVLKHFELNANAYKDSVKVKTDDAGQRYMIIDADQFEHTAKRFFGLNVSASDCPGYSGGKITVTADNANAVIKIASVLDTTNTGAGTWYNGNYQYECEFMVYRSYSASVSNLYGSTFVIEPDDFGELLYKGSAVFEYHGDSEKSEFNTWDFTLVSYDVEGSPEANSGYLGDNVPYVSDSKTGETKESAKETEESGTTLAEGTTEAKPDGEKAGSIDEKIENEAENETSETKSGSKGHSLSLIVVFFIVFAGVVLVGGLVAIIVIVLMKRR